MLDKLEAIYSRFIEVEKLISSPEAMNDMKLYVQLNKEYKDLTPIIKEYKIPATIISRCQRIGFPCLEDVHVESWLN